MTITKHSSWFFRFFCSLILLYLLTVLGDASSFFLAVLKIVSEEVLPSVLPDLRQISASPSGGWDLHTNIRVVGTTADWVVVGVDPIFLRRALLWAPAALAMIVATHPRNFRIWSLGIAVSLLCAVLLVAICVAAHLAIAVNGEPSRLDDGLLPQPPHFETISVPYPKWYFDAVTFAFYLTVVIAPMAMPVIVWLTVCRRDIGSYLAKYNV